jgi:hypothetical protein
VLDDERVINEGGLRWPDEFVRHKTLDLFGDLALLGTCVRGHVHVDRGGHTLHQRLVSAILANADAWRLDHPDERVAGAFEANQLRFANATAASNRSAFMPTFAGLRVSQVHRVGKYGLAFLACAASGGSTARTTPIRIEIEKNWERVIIGHSFGTSAAR